MLGIQTHRESVQNRSFEWLANHNPGAPVLLLLHGFPDRSDIWEKWFEKFGPDFQIYAPDLPRAPEVRQARFSMDALVLDYLQFLKNDLNRDRPLHIVGHDVGAALGARLAQVLGRKVLSLTMINGLSLEQFRRRLKNPKQLLKSWYMPLMQVPGLPEIVLMRFGGLFRRVVKRVTKVDQNIATNPSSYPVYRAWFRDLVENHKGPGARVKADVLVLFSAQDEFLIAPDWNEFEPFAENFEIRIVPGRHWAHIERADEFTELVHGFMKRRPSHES